MTGGQKMRPQPRAPVEGRQLVHALRSGAGAVGTPDLTDVASGHYFPGDSEVGNAVEVEKFRGREELPARSRHVDGACTLQRTVREIQVEPRGAVGARVQV